MTTWKEQLGTRIPTALGEEIDTFARQIELRKSGKIEPKVFAETRLRRGVYGQRYDNGQRHDGSATRTLVYPSGALEKGPETKWDAPGMQRIKIPWGGLNATQLETLADLAEEYADGIAHITTRQDIQLHFVSIDDTPDLMRRLAAAGITTREACGNSVRNVTACHKAGVCRDEKFDVTPVAEACARFLLGHKDCQDFGRKFKPAFSGCSEHACGLVYMHDVGAVAKSRVMDGTEERGFAFYVGGGLGSVPHQAVLFDDFLPEAELLPTIQAIARVFARLGEKTNRAKARIKFLVAKLGIDEFRRIVRDERSILPHDPAWTAWITPSRTGAEAPASESQAAEAPLGGFENWRSTNVYPQRQAGFAIASITAPLGDLTARQLRVIADLARRFTRETIRTTVEQNIVLRWVRESDLPALYNALEGAGLGESGAESIVDITACPGTDTCKLGIASSRGLAAELRGRLAARGLHHDAALKDIRIKISGCFNSCGQHHVAEIGFYGVSRNFETYTVPHFQVLLGGQWSENAAAYGLGICAIPSKRIPEAVDLLLERYVRERNGTESFREFTRRIGKKAARDLLSPLTRIPSHANDASLYTDWGDAREFTIGDMGQGECAGEVVSVTEFGFADAERRLFDAQVTLEEASPKSAATAAEQSLASMTIAAKALIRMQYLDVADDPAAIVREFRARYFDTQLFWDRFAGGKFAQHFFDQYEARNRTPDSATARRLVEEAQLFIEAAHKCQARVLEEGAQGRLKLTVNPTGRM